MALVILHLPAEEAESHAFIDQLNNTNFEFCLSTSPDDFMESAKFFEKRLREGDRAETTPATLIFWNNQQGDVKPPMEVIVKQEPTDEEAAKEPSKIVAEEASSLRDASNELEAPIATENSPIAAKSGGEKGKRRNEELGHVRGNKFKDQSMGLPKAAVVQKASDSGKKKTFQNGGGGVSRGKKRIQLEDPVFPDFGGVDEDFGGLHQPSFDQNLTRRREAISPSQKQEATGLDLAHGALDQSIGDGSGGQMKDFLGGIQKQRKRRIEIHDEDDDDEDIPVTPERRRSCRSVVPTKFYGEWVGDGRLKKKANKAANLRLKAETDSGDQEEDKAKKFPKCPVAGCVDDFTENLKKHMKGHAKPLTCRFCPYQNANLRIHYRSHTGERPFACDTCPMRFSTKDILKVHQVTHSGERPFSCGDCGQRFTQRGSVARHARSAHTREEA